MDRDPKATEHVDDAAKHKDNDQPDYSPDSQVEAFFSDESPDALNQGSMQNSIQNAQFNINNPIMPAKEMAQLEEAYPGAIDRILSMGELEQAFTHQVQERLQGEHIRLNDRNIEISREQTELTNKKINLTAVLIVIMVGCAVILFAFDKTIGGVLMVALSAAVAIIFVLGQSPDSLFNIFKASPPNNPDE